MRENILEFKSILDMLKAPSYLSRDDHEHKFRASKQRTNTSKYCFTNRI